MTRGCFVVPLSAGLLAMTVAGCATIYNPATGRQETVLDSSVEIALGNLARAQMGLMSLNIGRVSPEDLQRVQGIGARIAAVSDRRDVPYRFGVIREKSINAFTLPGGTIYVHTGVLDRATNDELAAVIAHEVGHVAARHVAKHLQADLGFTVLLAIAQASGVGAESARLADSLYDLFSRGFSRQDELEADRIGIRYAQRAGFDPGGMVTFFEKMFAEKPEGLAERTLIWQSTHPLTSDRIAKAKEEIAKLEKGAAAPPDASSTPLLAKQAAVQAQMGKFCPECGRAYSDPKARFCEQDGTPLKEKRL